MKAEFASIYYLSGTGNSLSAAHIVAETLQRHQISTSVTSIDFKQGGIHKQQERVDGLLGLCYPTHGFGVPWAMLKFVWQLPFARKGERFFLLNTRAGTRIYNIFIPGISGMAQLVPLIILLVKGYRLAGLLPLDMPSNWISIHPGMAPWVFNPIVERCNRIVKRFATRIAEGRRYLHPYVFIFLPLDLFLIPIGIAYQAVGRFLLSKTFFATTDCNGCNLCVEKCPVGAVKLVDGRPFWTFSCESCMRCMNICPQRAIQTPHLFAAVLITIVAALPVTQWLHQQLELIIPSVYNSFQWPWNLLVASMVNIPIFFVVYYGFHFLVRYGWINRLFRYTSLTYYWRRYLAPAISAKDFTRK